MNSYVHALKLYKSSDKSIDIAAKCFRSMRKSEAPHKMNMTITITTSSVSESLLMQSWSKRYLFPFNWYAIHFHYIHYKNLGMAEVPSTLACTSMPQQWHKPRGSKISPEPLSAMVFSKHKQTPRKKRPIHSIIPKMRIPDIGAMEVKKLKTDSAAVGTPLSYLLQEEVQLIETTLGGVQMGSMLPYQLKNYVFSDHCTWGLWKYYISSRH